MTKALKLMILVTVILISVLAFFFFAKVPKCVSITPTSTDELPDAEMNDLSFAEFRASFEDNPIKRMYFAGASMVPTIIAPAVCDCIETNDYQVGDIVVFPYNNNGSNFLVGHRIINETFYNFTVNGNFVTERVVVTKGDANPVTDGRMNEDQIFCEIPQISINEYAQWRNGGYA